MQYVGESLNTMNTRCKGHVSTIRTSKDHPVALHYRAYNHTTEASAITIIDKDQDKNRRLRLEESWITLLDTLTPKGLNGRWLSPNKNLQHCITLYMKHTLNRNDTFCNTNNNGCKMRQPSGELLIIYYTIPNVNKAIQAQPKQT